MPLVSSPISQRIDEYFDFDKRLFFFIVVLVFVIIRFVTNDLILQSIPGYEQLADDGTFLFFYVFNVLGYLWTPFALLWKFTLTAFILWIGGFAFGYRVSFKKLWQYIMVIELIFILPELIKMLYFMTLPESVNYKEIRDFYPLSAFSLFSGEDTESKYRYPLQVLNIFEFLYIYLLILVFHTVSKRSIRQSTWVVLSVYIPVLLAWLGFYILVYK
jgi:hypothetical protein